MFRSHVHTSAVDSTVLIKMEILLKDTNAEQGDKVTAIPWNQYSTRGPRRRG